MSRPSTRSGPSLAAIDENRPANHGFATAGVAPKGSCRLLRRLRRKLMEERRAEEERRVRQIYVEMRELRAQLQRGEITSEEYVARTDALHTELEELEDSRARRRQARQRAAAAGDSGSDSGESLASDDVRRDIAGQLEEEAHQPVGDAAAVEAAQAGGQGAPPVAAQQPEVVGVGALLDDSPPAQLPAFGQVGAEQQQQQQAEAALAQQLQQLAVETPELAADSAVARPTQGPGSSA